MIDAYVLDDIKEQSRALYKYMLHELSLMMTICSVFLCIDGSKEAIKKHKDIWKYLKSKDSKTYRKLRYTSIAAFSKLHGKPGRKAFVAGYRMVHRIYKFN